MPFNALVELVASVTVMFTALMASMFTALTALTGFAFPAFTFLVLPALLALPVLAPVFVVDLNDIIRRGYSEGGGLESRRWSARQSECRDGQCKTKACGCDHFHKESFFLPEDIFLTKAQPAPAQISSNLFNLVRLHTECRDVPLRYTASSR